MCIILLLKSCLKHYFIASYEMIFPESLNLSISIWLRVENESTDADSDPDLDDQCIFVPVPYGIKVDRTKVQLIVRKGIQGIIINTKVHGE